jgi:hypothetical protein
MPSQCTESMNRIILRKRPKDTLRLSISHTLHLYNLMSTHRACEHTDPQFDMPRVVLDTFILQNQFTWIISEPRYWCYALKLWSQATHWLTKSMRWRPYAMLPLRQRFCRIIIAAVSAKYLQRQIHDTQAFRLNCWRKQHLTAASVTTCLIA